MNVLMADALSSDLSIGPGWGNFGNLPVGISHWILSYKPLLYLKCHVQKFQSSSINWHLLQKCIQSEKKLLVVQRFSLKICFSCVLVPGTQVVNSWTTIELFMKEIMTFIKLHFLSLCTKALALFIICWTSSFPFKLSCNHASRVWGRLQK